MNSTVDNTENKISNSLTFEDLEPLEPIDWPILPPRPTENLVRSPEFYR